MTWVDKDELLQMAFEGKDIRSRLPEMIQAIMNGDMQANEATRIIRTANNDELTGMAVIEFSELLFSGEYPENMRHMREVIRFLQETAGNGIEQAFIRYTLEDLVADADRKFLDCNSEEAICRLQAIWDAEIELPKAKFNRHLMDYITWYDKENKTRPYEVALNIFIDMNAREGNFEMIRILLNNVSNFNPGRMALLFSTLDIGQLDALDMDAVQDINMRLSWQVSMIEEGTAMPQKIDNSIILLERMAGKAMDVDSAMENVEKLREVEPDFDRTYPNLAYTLQLRKLGIKVDGDFARSFRGPNCMMERQARTCAMRVV